VNASGQAVGYAGLAGQDQPTTTFGFGFAPGLHAASFSNGKVTDLGTLGGQSSFATAINNAGQIVGSSQTADGTSHAFLLSGGVMTDLGALSASHVVSGSYVDLRQQGYSNVHDVFESIAKGINNAGQVVGDSFYEQQGTTSSGGSVGGGVSIAFLYDHGQMYDLKSLLASNSNIQQIDWVYGINDLGQILAHGVLSDVGEAYLVLTPTDLPPAPYIVPESVPLGSLSALALFVVIRHLRKCGRVRGAGGRSSAPDRVRLLSGLSCAS
jgi:probable HAF family extracellular repeat protein